MRAHRPTHFLTPSLTPSLPLLGGGRFPTTVEERNIWAHRVFNAGGDLAEEIVKHRNWDINRRKVWGKCEEVWSEGGCRS